MEYLSGVGKLEKIIEKMRRSPKDWRINSLEVVAKSMGMKIRKSGGSHAVFLHTESDLVVTVPAKRPIKPIYITKFLALVDDIGA